MKRKREKEGIDMTKKISDFTREERRTFAKKGLAIVRRDGVQGASVKPIQAVVMGAVPQGYVKGIIHLDPETLSAVQPYTVQAGSIYEQCRAELLRRMQTPDEAQGIPAYSDIVWDGYHQKGVRALALAQWQSDRSDESAYLYAISCLPLECWHWRMCLWHTDQEVIVIDHLLPRLARRGAGRAGIEALEQGMAYASRESEKQAEQMAKQKEFLPDFRHDEVHEDAGYVLRDGQKLYFSPEEFIEAWELWKNEPQAWETPTSYGYDYESSASYRAYLNCTPTQADLERSALWHEASRWER